MKRLLLLLIFPISCFAQEVDDTCFTEQEILDISFTLDSLYKVIDINDNIIIEQEFLIDKQSKLIELDSIQLSYKTQQIDLLQKNINLYVEREKRLQPKWFDNKAIWFGSGILTTLFTGVIINQYLK
jgi:hypothetical protein